MKKIYFLIFIFSNYLYSSGLQFLRIKTFSSSSGMGEAFTGISGYESIYYNPAGYVGFENEKTILSMGYSSWIENTKKSSVLFIPNRNKFLKAISIDYFTISGLKEYDNSGGEIGKLSYNDIAVTLNLGKKISIFDFGLNLKMLNEKISSYKGTGYAFDAGLIFPLKERIKIGVSYLNSGSFKLKGEGEKLKVDLPQELRIGASFEKNNFLIDADWENVDSKNIIHIGGQIKFQDKYFLRAGYISGSTNKGLSFGFGIESELKGGSSWGSSGMLRRKKKGTLFIFNYSYTPFSEFESSIHKFDIGIKF